jgi:cytochrome P450
VSVQAPEQLSSNPFRRIASDLWGERAITERYPPGPKGFDLALTRDFMRDPLRLMLSLYEEHGPIFSLRLFHMRDVFMLGPAANHYITVSHADNFHWREGGFGDLIPLLGDGLLTIDDAYHDRARRIMMPAFHRERVEASVQTMVEEAGRALDGWQVGETVDVYDWARNLAMRIAMRALFGLDPDDGNTGASAAHHFERALYWYSTDPWVRVLRGPGTPWRRLNESRAVLDEIILREITSRRGNPDSGRSDILSLLIDSRDEDGSGLSDIEIRDQVMTLLFAGHDTSTSTITFMLYELARNPGALAKLCEEQDRVLGGDPPSAEHAGGAGLPYLELVLDETLRLYPPAWIGPRRAMRAFEFEGCEVPARAYLNYSSWASHRIPEVFPQPEAFIPERFERERKAALPKGAYVPFGGGQRICIGKRFGQTEVRIVATMLLQRFAMELRGGHTMSIRQMPTLSPRGGLEMVVRERGSLAAPRAVAEPQAASA